MKYLTREYSTAPTSSNGRWPSITTTVILATAAAYQPFGYSRGHRLRRVNHTSEFSLSIIKVLVPQH